MENSGKIRNLLVLIMKLLLVLIILIPIILFIPRLITHFCSLNKIFTMDNTPVARIAIVFGAGLRRDGTPTAVLRDRVATGVDLYRSGKVEKLLMSGDNRYQNYNEPGAMADYAHTLGVPYEDIIMDFAGRRTYDTCYRAKFIFQVDEAILVTQSFHLPRAIYTCSSMNIQTSGVLANKRTYSRAAYTFWQLRETLATLRAMWDIWIQKPVPVLGSPEPIFAPIDDNPPSKTN